MTDQRSGDRQCDYCDWCGRVFPGDDAWIIQRRFTSTRIIEGPCPYIVHWTPDERFDAENRAAIDSRFRIYDFLSVIAAVVRCGYICCCKAKW